MVTCCSHCGADLSFRPAGAVLGHWDPRCPDCGLAVDEEAGTLVPGQDEVEYPLAEWSPRDRIELRRAVSEAGVPWRWEPGPSLVVPEEDQETVEAVLDELEAEEAEEDPDAVAALDDEYDEESVEEEEAAQNAMGELFVVTDRLQHTPWSGELVAEVDRLLVTVEDTPPPFGVDAAAWEKIGALAAAVVDAADAGDDDAVAEAARSLRAFLRDYV